MLQGAVEECVLYVKKYNNITGGESDGTGLLVRHFEQHASELDFNFTTFVWKFQRNI